MNGLADLDDDLMRTILGPGIAQSHQCPRCSRLDGWSLTDCTNALDRTFQGVLTVRCHGDTRRRTIVVDSDAAHGPDQFIDALVDQLRPTLWTPGYFLRRYAAQTWAALAWCLRVQPLRYAAGIG